MIASSIILATFGSVLLAELAGDRSMYAIVSLASRFRPSPVLLGVGMAYALKMLAAVLVADAIAHIAPVVLAAISCLTWVIAAWAVWVREKEPQERASIRSPRPSLVAFASIAFTEWGDPGQLTAALLAAHFRAPLLVWGAATAALLTKAGAALLLGVTAQRYLNRVWLRSAAAAFCIVNAAVSVVGALRAT